MGGSFRGVQARFVRRAVLGFAVLPLGGEMGAPRVNSGGGGCVGRWPRCGCLLCHIRRALPHSRRRFPSAPLTADARRDDPGTHRRQGHPSPSTREVSWPRRPTWASPLGPFIATSSRSLWSDDRSDLSNCTGDDGQRPDDRYVWVESQPYAVGGDDDAVGDGQPLDFRASHRTVRPSSRTCSRNRS